MGLKLTEQQENLVTRHEIKANQYLDAAFEAAARKYPAREGDLRLLSRYARTAAEELLHPASGPENSWDAGDFEVIEEANDERAAAAFKALAGFAKGDGAFRKDFEEIRKTVGAADRKFLLENPRIAAKQAIGALLFGVFARGYHASERRAYLTAS